MNLAVFVKHVPDTNEAELSVAEDGKTLKTQALPYQMNEWDRFGLEAAVQLKEATGGTLTAFLLGPEEQEESLRRCLAVGADRAVRVWDQALAEAGPLGAAKTLHAAMKGEKFDLVLCGAQASDDGYALVGPTLATLLGLPSATLVNKLEVSGSTARCTRELEGGWGEVVDLDLPAVVTIQTGINEPRYVSVLGIKKARSKPIDLLDLAAVGLSADALAAEADKVRQTGLTPPPPGKRAEIWSGSKEEIAISFVAAMVAAGGVK